jgi:hypothetical protein
MLRRVHGLLLHRVRLAQLEQARIGAEQRFVVGGHGGHGRRALGSHRDDAARGVVCVGADQRLKSGAQPGLLVNR